jgi:hypothetical protein
MAHIERTYFTEEENQELRRLLRKVKDNGCRWPTEETMQIGHGVVSYWAPELVITRPGRQLHSRVPEILLAIYDGGAKWFMGMWHIPGGYNEWPELDVQATVSRVAKREIGVDVIAGRTIDEYKWRDGEHPYGHPLSLYKECQPVATIIQDGRLQYFPCTALPKNIIEPHRRFIEEKLL